MANTKDSDNPLPADGQSSIHEEQRENNRSAVRMVVTYVATGFLFVVGAAITG